MFMFYPLLLIAFGIAGVAKGEFKITKNRRVSSSMGRTLGIVLLVGGILSLVFNFLWVPTLAIGIAVGLVTAERIDGVHENLTGRQKAIRFSIGIGIVVLIVIIPIALLTLLGPLMGDIVQKYYGAPIASQSLVKSTANEINLQVNEVGNSFSLDTENTRESFVGGHVIDGNQRLFTSQGVVVQSRVIIFDGYPSDTTDDLRKAVEQGLAQEFNGDALEFEVASDFNIGDRGSLQKFINKDTGLKGYVLIFLKQNVLVRLIYYGAPEKLNLDDLQKSTLVIESRIR